MSETPCKNCSFAVFTNNGITQSECQLNLLENFANRNIEVREAYDDDKEFFVIGAVCPFFRNNNPSIDNLWVYHNSPNKIEQVYKEVRLYFTLVIYIDHNITEKQIIKTINNIKNLTIKPSSIIIISVRGQLKPSVLRSHCDVLDIPYKLEFAVGDLTIEDAIDIASTKTTSPFVIVSRPYKTITNKFIELLNTNVQTLQPFLVYIPKTPDLHKLTIQRELFNLLGKNTSKSFLDKFTKIEDYEKFTIYE